MSKSTSDNKNKVPVLVYGSLRHGQYNYQSFAREFDIEYVKTGKIKGYQLHSLGWYPAIQPSKNPDTELVVDLLMVEPDCKYAFDRMELGAGYKIEKVDFEGELVDIYVYINTDWLESRPVVESGDWAEYMKIKEAV